MRTATRRVAAVALAACTFLGNANAACVNALGSDTPAAWKELRDLTVGGQLNPAIESVLSLGTATGPLNTDYYAVTIDAAGKSPQQIAQDLRSNLNEIVFGASSDQSFRPYDAANQNLWARANPTGAVMTFVLAKLGAEWEKGSVVVSCSSGADWVFSTVETDDDGLHPVSGNRGFGVVRNSDGSLTIFTKATDRATNSIFAALGVFDQGHAVWSRFVDNLKQRYRDRNPRNIRVISRRIAFP